MRIWRLAIVVLLSAIALLALCYRYDKWLEGALARTNRFTRETSRSVAKGWKEVKRRLR